MLLYRVADEFRRHKVRYALVGGYAVALHGAVRGTLDIDVVISLSRSGFQAAERALRNLGMEPRLPVSARQVFDFRKEYIRERNLIAWSFYNPIKPIEVVDILITEDLERIKLKKMKIEGHAINVASIQDLIRMKRSSGRPQDLADIEALRTLLAAPERGP